ncbi:MAG: hypothetical protein H6832_02335 [Planctomycetes bacterium]|nr:hypothetical protein [Planctomycetota bacterium]
MKTVEPWSRSRTPATPPEPLLGRKKAASDGSVDRLASLVRETVPRLLASECAVLLALLTVGIAFFAYVVTVVREPARLARSLNVRIMATRCRYIAEDVMRRSLSRSDLMRAGERLILAEGELSPDPTREAWVELRQSGGQRSVLCGIRRGSALLVYRAAAHRGRILPCMTSVFASLEPARDVDVRSHDQSAIEPELLDAMPFQDPRSWKAADVDVDRATLANAEADRDALTLAAFRLANELGMAMKGTPTELDNFVLGNYAFGNKSSERIVAAFQSQRDLVVRVHGHLWIGARDKDTVIGTSGRSLLILVDGDVHIRGSVVLQGESDRVRIVAGRPGFGSFRDLDGNGIHDEGEVRLRPHRVLPVLTPSEGAGRIHIGDDLVRPHVTLDLCATQDLVVGRAGAEIRGRVLCRGVRRLGEDRASLVVIGRAQGRAESLAPRGYPLVAGSDGDETISEPRLWKRVDSKPAEPMRIDD